MLALSIILFFLYCWGIGLGLGLLVKESEDFLERNLMRLGFGLGAIPAIGLLFNLVKIPLDWRIFLFVSLIPVSVIVIRFLRKGQKFGFKFNANLYAMIMLVLFFVSFYMYSKGAFAYPYLEDDDAWSHAIGVKYVSIEKTVFGKDIAAYLEPYPPAYDLLLGILHQTNNSVYWTLKFFNALIVSLSIIFFYYFAKLFTKSSKKALFSVFALFAVPAFLSHFIWALALTVPLYFVSFYAVEKIKEDRKWTIVAAIVMITTLTSSPTHSAYFGLFFAIYFLSRVIIERRILIYEFLAAFSALAFSFILWWLPMIMKYGIKGVLQSVGIGGPRGNPNVFSIAGTGDRIYTLSDFIFAKEFNMINNPIGIGIVLSILTIIGFFLLIFKYRELLKKGNYHYLIIILWFLFTFYAVNAARFYIKLSPFRAWMLLAIPVALLSGEAINLINDITKSLTNFIKSAKLTKAISVIVLILIVYGIIMTSFVQKYAVNTTASWPPGAFWTSLDEVKGYAWVKDNLPKNSRVFTFVNNGPVIGMDMYTCHWCSNVHDYKINGFNQTAEQNYNWLKQEQYKYIIIDGQTVRKFGINETNSKIQEFINSNKFKPLFTNNGVIVLEIF